MAVYNPLLLQFQRIWCPRLASMDNRHAQGQSTNKYETKKWEVCKMIPYGLLNINHTNYYKIIYNVIHMLNPLKVPFLANFWKPVIHVFQTSLTFTALWIKQEASSWVWSQNPHDSRNQTSTNCLLTSTCTLQYSMHVCVQIHSHTHTHVSLCLSLRQTDTPTNPPHPPQTAIDMNNLCCH